MTNQSTIDKLIEMRLTSMSDAFIVQKDDPKMKDVSFEDLSIPACFIPSFRREDTANPVDKIPQFREWSTIIPELDTADFLNLYTVFMRLTA